MRAKLAGSPKSGFLALALCALSANICGARAAPAANVPQTSNVTAFAVVSIKPSLDTEADDWGIGIRGRNFWAVHVTTNELIAWAYGVNARQIENAPGWLATDRFDVDGLPDTDSKPSREQYRTMLQSALAERFALKFNPSQKVLSVFVLSVANGGLKVSKSDDPNAKSSWGVHRGWLSIRNMTFADAAKVMQRTTFDRPVLDRTGLSDRYTFILKWRADETQFTQMQGVEVPQETGTEDVEDIYAASHHQLGIRIEAKKAQAPIMVIETVSHPSPN